MASSVFGTAAVALIVLVGAGACGSSPSPPPEDAFVLLRFAPTTQGEISSEYSAGILRNRLRALGDGSTVKAQKDGRVRIDLDQPSSTRNIAIATIVGGRVAFRPVVAVSAPPCPLQEAAPAYDQPGTLMERDSDGGRCYEVKPAELDGLVIERATASTSEGSSWSVDIHFTVDGERRFDALAARTIDKQLAIVVDDRVISAPTILSADFGRVATISGVFNEKEARSLAAVLSAHPLLSEVIDRECFPTACGSHG